MKGVHSNSVVESKVTPGWRYASTPRSGLPSAVASHDLEGKGHMGRWEYAYGVWARQRNTQRGRRAMRGVGKRKPALLQSLESLQYKKAGRRDRGTEGSRESRWW